MIMNFIYFSSIFLAIHLFFISIVYSIDELSGQQAIDGQLTINQTRDTSENRTSNIDVFKRDVNCFTRRFGNYYRKICRNRHNTRFGHGINNQNFYEKPANSPFYGFNQNFVEFPYRNSHQRRNRYRNQWTHQRFPYFPNRPYHRIRRPSPRPVSPKSLPATQPNGYLIQNEQGDLIRPKTVNREHCGTRSYNPLGGRIVGGRPAEEKEFPWQVGIQEDDGDNNYQITGGAVIIDKRWVLTAAHVFEGKQNANNHRGVIGVTDLNGDAKYIKFDKLIKHDKYADEAGNFDNDIALLHTTEDIPLYPNNDRFNNICLPDENDQFKGSVTVSGWGKTHEQGPETNQLMTVDIQVLKDAVCEKNFKHHFKRRLMICAGNIRGGKDSCSGDSGGPLIKRKPDNRWYLVGIVSFGGHQKCARKGSGASYTKVTRYIPWILKHIKE